LADKPTEVNEMLLGCRALLESGIAPFGEELLGCHGMPLSI
jgi:hypothetical protein